MSHVDTSSPITHVSLCAGYGGIDLGLRRVLPALRTIAYAEREGFCCANLVAKMEAGLLDPAPIWTDVKTFPWAEFRDCVDILSGGYPCQPFSAAGKRLGAEDPRHLWPHISAGIALMRPSVCFFENVEGHISLGLPDVIEDLAGLGYRTTWGIFSASEVGAPHQRKRVFILAYRHGERGQLQNWWRVAAEQVPVGYGETWRDDAMANTQLHGRDHANARPHADGVQGPLGQGHEHRQALRDGQLWPSRPGEQQFAWEPPRVVADSKRSERRQNDNGRSEESAQEADRVAACGEAMGQPSSQRCEQAERAVRGEQQPSGTGEECGLGAAEAMGNAAQRQDHGREPRDVGTAPSEGDREAESPLGRDADGPADWLDDAELFTTCDNRTDELRLLGNGVVPATAERAFRVLITELAESESWREPANG